MTIAVTYNGTLTTSEVPVVAATHMTAGQKIVSTLGQSLGGLVAGSTPPCYSRAGADLAMSGGTATLDLTAAIGLNGATVSGATKRVQFAKFAAPAANNLAVTIAQGASNGYDGFGADFSITLEPGAEVLYMLNTAGAVIGGANKILDITGTTTDAISYEIIFG